MTPTPLTGNAATYADLYPHYPADTAAAYVQSGMWGTQSILAAICEAAQQHPNRTAVSDATRSLTYTELMARIELTAAALNAQGIQPRDVVVLHHANSVTYLELCLALFAVRAVPVFALPAHGPHELASTIAASGARHLITASDFAPGGVAVHDPATLTEPSEPSAWLAHGCAADAAELAFFQLSGGTTATSKLIPRHHREYAYSYLESAKICGITAATVFLAVLPLAHNFTMSSPGFLGVLASGGHVTTLAEPDTAHVFATIMARAVTHIAAVPALVQQWLNANETQRETFATVTTLQVGGARFAPALAERVQRELGCGLQQVYGMAEGLVCYTRPTDPASLTANCQGRPISPADEVRIVDIVDAECPVGTIGEILVRGPYTIRGYFNSPDINATAFTAAGFYRTGDLGWRDANGNLTVTGRIKDQINRAGEKIVPAELEDLLLQHPQIHDVSIVASTHDISGEEPHAYVVPRPGYDTLRAKHVRQFLRERGVAGFKIPALVSIVAELPHTAVGKVHRGQLRENTPQGTTTTRENSPHILDVIGVGLGPTNLALACAIAESPEPMTHVFLEAQSETRWHPGLLFPDAAMQISFVKDLVTLRNPSSPYSFLAFLHTKGRLLDFLNRGSTTALRMEFAQYLTWVAHEVTAEIRYDSRVTAITPRLDAAGRVHHFSLETANGHEYLARSVVIGTGLQPNLPDFVAGASAQVFHSSEFLPRLAAVTSPVRRAVVIGAGQSAAECLEHLHETYPDTEVHSVISRYGLIPSDSSPYVNQVFDPELIDTFYQAPQEVRDQLLAQHAATNYSVTSQETVTSLFEREYRDALQGQQRLFWHRMSRVTALTETRDGVRVDITHGLDGTTESLTADLVVCATGYRPLDPHVLLGPNAALLGFDAAGRLKLDRNYAAQFVTPSPAQLFLPGHSQHTHGLTATLLSNVAVRSGEILTAVHAAAREKVSA